MSVVNRNRLQPKLKQIFFSLEFELLLSVLLVGLDQWTKWWFQMRDEVVMNTGGFLGALPDFWWLGGLTMIWIILVRHWVKYENGWYRFGLLLVLIGGLGNLLDRIIFGFVRDFIFYPFLGFYGNLADIFLVLGVLTCLSVNLLLQYKPCEPDIELK